MIWRLLPDEVWGALTTLLEVCKIAWILVIAIEAIIILVLFYTVLKITWR